MLPGETVASGASSNCPECKEPLELDVLWSGAGYFLGYGCGNHGVSTRETEYFPNESSAAEALENFLTSGILKGQRQ